MRSLVRTNVALAAPARVLGEGAALVLPPAGDAAGAEQLQDLADQVLLTGQVLQLHADGHAHFSGARSARRSALGSSLVRRCRPSASACRYSEIRSRSRYRSITSQHNCRPSSGRTTRAFASTLRAPYFVR